MKGSRARASVQHHHLQHLVRRALLHLLPMVLLALLLHTAPRRGGVVVAVAAATASTGAKKGGAAFVPTAILQSVYNKGNGRARRHVAAAFFSSSSFSSSSSCPAPRGPPHHQRQQGRALASVLNSNANPSSASSLSTKASPASASSVVVKVMGEGEGGIKKPARDDRQYRMLWLRNGMQVLLASDPTTDLASASMNIHAGHFQDPDEFPGLAHFHEHMLFLGTERFPKEGEYEAFLNEHGGSSNAYTAMEDTNYYFSVNWNHLHGAMDRFSSFFTCPTFDNSSTEREMNAVNSEHQMNQQDDGWRLFQLNKATAHPQHPYHKFGSGNLETLRPRPEEGLDTREALIKFHTTYYSADIMKLAVIGREPLDTLQEWVTDLFGGVRTTGQPSHYTYPVEAFDAPRLGTRLSAVPVRELRRLSLAWPLPYNWEKQFALRASKPSRYLAHVLGHEGPGSLHSYLNQQGWIESLSAGTSLRTADMEVFKLSLSLTQAGLAHTDDIIALVHQYLHLLKTRPGGPVDPEVFQELKTMSEIKFTFREKEGAVDFASGVSSLMQDLPAEEILWGPYALEMDAAAIEEYLGYLTPQRLQLQVVSKAFEQEAAAAEARGEPWAKEKWYGTPHKMERIPEAQMAEWANPPSVHPALTLPKPNDFIPTDFELRADLPQYQALPPETPSNSAERPPALVATAPGLRLYHKLDRAFRVPKAFFFAHLLSRQVYSSPTAVVMHRLYNMLLRDELNEYAYDAATAGLAYSVTTRTTGLSVKVSGYSHKLPVLLDRVSRRITSYLQELKAKAMGDAEVQRKFEKHRAALLREYINFDAEAPYERVLYNTRQVLDGQCWHLQQYRAVLEAPDCTPQQMAAYVEEGLSRMDCHAFAHGNLEASEAQALAETLTSALQPMKPLYDGEAPEERAVELPDSTTVVFQQDGLNPEEDNSAAEVFIQIGPTHLLPGGSTKEDVTLDMISHIASTSAYQRLRTELQLGYISFLFSRKNNGAQGLSVVVQSPSSTPPEIDGHIEDWMLRFRDELSKMTDAEFANHVKAVESMKLEKDKRLSEEAYRHWGQIVERRLDFHREKREVAALRTLTKADALKLWDEKIAASAPRRRKLAVYVFSRNHAGSKLKDEGKKDGVVLVESMEGLRKLKRGLALYGAPGAVVKEEELLAAASGGGAPAAAAAS